MKGIRIYTQEWTSDQYLAALELGDRPDPTDTEGWLYDVADIDDGDDVDVAIAMLNGRHGADFWLQEASSFPAGPGCWYESQYVNPYSGAVEEKTAHLVGDWTPDEETRILAGATRRTR